MKGFPPAEMHRNSSANRRSLIANETHSRKQSNHCNQSTYKFLIANEFHPLGPAFQPCMLKVASSGRVPRPSILWLLLQGATPILCALIVVFSFASGVALAQSQPGSAASAATQPPAKPASPFTVELYSTKVHFNSDGTGERRLDVRIRVAAEAGAEELRTLSFRYNADFESFALSYMRVKKSDGSVVEAKPDALKDSSITLAKDAPAFSSIHDVQIATPSLAPGDTLDYEVTARNIKPAAPGQFWYSHSFLTGTRASDEELRIEVPADRQIHIHWAPQFVPVVTTEGAQKIYSWKRNDSGSPASDKSQSDSAASKSSAPDVMLTSFTDWPALGKWIAAAAQNAGKPSPEISDKVNSLTASAKTDTDKIEALYDFVSKQIRLVAVNPDESEYQIRDAAKVLADGYGDTFDKCSLLVAMLGAAGLHGDLALLSTNGALDPGFPTPSSLTHAIVSVTAGNDTIWLDPAQPTMPFRLLTPNLRNKQALIASAVAPHFAETPADPPFLSTQRVEIAGRVSSLGILTARVQYTLRGDNEYALRMAFFTSPKEQWKQVAQTMATLDGLRGEVVSVNPGDPTATRDPFVLQFNLADPEFLDWSQKQFVLPLPLPTFGMPDAPAGASKPIPLGSPLDVMSKLTLTLPVTDSIRAPAGAASVRDYAEYHSSYDAKDNVVTAQRSLRFLKREVPASRAEDYATFTRAVQGDESQGIVVNNIVPDIPADASPRELMVAGGAALKSRRFSNALRLFRRVQELDPKQAGLWNDLGLAQLQLGQFSDAEASFRKQIETNPADTSANNLLGVALFNQKKYNDAAAAFEKQISLKPLDASAHSSLGEVYIQQEKFQAAISELEKAAVITPDDAGIQVRLGEAYLGLKDSQSALKAFDKAVAASPSAGVKNEVAYSLAEHNVSLDRAEEFARSALDMLEAQVSNLSLNRATLEQIQAAAALPPIWDTLGWVYFRQGKLDRALDFVDAAWRLNEQGDVGDHLGQIYEKRGERALAIRTYALSLAAGSASSSERQRLEKLLGSSAQVEARIKQAKQELLRMHSILLGKSSSKGKAAFVVLLEPAPEGSAVREARFLSGDANLQPMGGRLQAAKFPKLFPEGSKAHLALRGQVTCSTTSLACEFTYQPPSQLLAGR